MIVLVAFVADSVGSGVESMSKKQMGSSIDAFLKEERILEEAQAEAIKEVVAWRLTEAMKNVNPRGSLPTSGKS
jgi:hypothetical protein